MQASPHTYTTKTGSRKRNKHTCSMKISDEVVYETGKACMDIAKLCIVALLITPFAQQLSIPLGAKIALLVTMVAFWIVGTKLLNSYAKRKTNQGRAFTPGKRKKMRFAKNTTFDIEEQP